MKTIVALNNVCVCVCLQGANLLGVMMLCSNAEGASLRGCNFEDPAGVKANLEGETEVFGLCCVCVCACVCRQRAKVLGAWAEMFQWYICVCVCGRS